MPLTPSLGLQCHPHSPGGKLFSGAQGPSHILAHCSFPCSRHTSHILLHPCTGAKPCAALEEGAVEAPLQGCPHWPFALSAPSGAPLPGAPSGAQTWALKLATVLSKVIFRPSDLQVPFSITLGEPGAPTTQGHPPFPSPAWPHCLGPSSWQGNYQDLLLVLGDSDQPCPVQEKPVPLNLGGPCSAALATSSPALSAGLQDLREPSVFWRCTYFLPA